jgi:hypothetical protein
MKHVTSGCVWSQLQDTAKYAPELPTEEDLAADPGLAQVCLRSGCLWTTLKAHLDES